MEIPYVVEQARKDLNLLYNNIVGHYVPSPGLMMDEHTVPDSCARFDSKNGKFYTDAGTAAYYDRVYDYEHNPEVIRLRKIIAEYSASTNPDL